MKLLVQQFLETHTLNDLIKNHGVYASVSKNKKHASFNYDMLEAVDHDPLSQECRGLILGTKDGSDWMTADAKLDLDCVIGQTQVLAFGLKRFFNYGQGNCAVNWSDPKLQIQNKLDGTLIQCWYSLFTGQWNISTRSIPEADIPLDCDIFTFRTLFEKALADTTGLSFFDFTMKLDIRYTYCFELCSLYNRIVCHYPDNTITLLAVRELSTFQELDINDVSHPVIAKLDFLPRVKQYPFSTIDNLVNWVSEFSPIAHEGVVVVDSQFNRIKIKNAQYVAFNKVRDALATSERNCMELILQGAEDDVIGFLPEEIVKNLLKIKQGLQLSIKRYDQAYLAANRLCPNDRKAFALLVKQDNDLWAAPFFAIYGGKCSNMREFIEINKKQGSWSPSFLDQLLRIAKS